MKQFRKYIFLWITQSISQLGSSMTGFALTLWAYGQTHSALSVSLMTFCNYVPYIIMSLFAGSFVDWHSKKAVMLISDSIAALGTTAVLFLTAFGRLEIWHIYLVNIAVGCTNAFQQPASAVAVGKLVPEDRLSTVSGMNSFSMNLITIISPVLAAFFYGTFGIWSVLVIDVASFLTAFLVLLCAISIPEEYGEAKKNSAFAGAKEGFRFLRERRGLLAIMLTMAAINFFSRLTYENILSPMILSRSNENDMVLGLVNAAMGAGGIAGGILVTLLKAPRHQVKMMYGSAAISFLCGDMLMAVGRNGIMWILAGVAASLPIPFIMAANNVIMYGNVPEQMQGRVFAVRNAIQYSTIPVGILLGGFLADYVMEPFMKSGSQAADLLGKIVGTGNGSGMALMFLCTSIAGCLISLLSYRNKEIRKLDQI